jgi:hypothetical protein
MAKKENQQKENVNRYQTPGRSNPPPGSTFRKPGSSNKISDISPAAAATSAIIAQSMQSALQQASVAAAAGRAATTKPLPPPAPPPKEVDELAVGPFFFVLHHSFHSCHLFLFWQHLFGNDAVGDQAAAADIDDAEIYDTYLPKKLKGGKPHPDHIVETTTMSLIAPPDISYEHHLQEVAETGALSAPQLEAITYAMQRYDSDVLDEEKMERPGFFLGDGAGVGKGRQIAGLVHENYAAGVRRFLWLSVSPDLHFDAERDMDDVRENTSLPKLALYPKQTANGTVER